jgi:transposase-like protein
MVENMTEKKLTPGQRKAIEALLTSGNVTAAATAAGVTRNTLYRWVRHDETFVAELQAAEAEAVQGLSRVLAGLGDSAAAALKDALDSSQKITVRLRAAEIVTDRLLKIRELVELEQRITELEKRV